MSTQLFSLSQLSQDSDSEDALESQKFIDNESAGKSSKYRSRCMSKRWLLVTNAALFFFSFTMLLIALHVHSGKAPAGGSGLLGSGLLSCE